ARHPGIHTERIEFTRSRRVWTCNDEKCLGPLLPGGERLVAQTGVAVEIGTAFRGDILGHIAKDQDDFVPDVESGIRIVFFPLLPGNTQAVPSKDDLSGNGAISSKG